MISTSAKIESLLFFRGEPISKNDIVKLLKITSTECDDGIRELEACLSERGIVLLKRDDDYSLGTHPELGIFFEAIRKEELSKELSKASLETIAIILYRKRATRGTIDYIRGVNSSFIIRNLLVRGLIEREQDSNDARAYMYKPSFDLLQYLGVNTVEALPNFAEYYKTLMNNASESAVNEPAS